MTAPPARLPVTDAPAALSLDAITDLRAAVDAHEAAIISAALARHRYNRRAAARGLNLSYDQLRHCMRKHGLSGE